MRETFRLLLLLSLLLVGCSQVTGVCGGDVVTTIIRFSGGTAPARLGTLEVYRDGCIRYSAGATRRCVCEESAVLREALSSADEVVAAIRIAPRTLVDGEGLSVSHGGVDAGRATVDLPPHVLVWLSTIDSALRSVIGHEYKPFVEE